MPSQADIERQRQQAAVSKNARIAVLEAENAALKAQLAKRAKSGRGRK